MTEREAIEKLKSDINRAKYAQSDYVDCVEVEVLDMAISALEKQEKCKWHDLKKDPFDLPDELHQVLTKVIDGYNPNVKYDCSWIYYGDWVHTEGVVIAWREIEPFEEGDTE